VIVAAAVCPHPPLLFRELSGREDVAAELRAACLWAVRSVTAAGAETLVVVGGADQSRAWDPTLAEEVRRFGTTRESDEPGLPLSLGIGTRLLHEAGWTGPVVLLGIAWDATPGQVAETAAQVNRRPERVGLLVLGDGSARRGEKAPGYLDERAFPYDQATGQALATGDVHALLDMDAGLAAELMVGGRPAFQVLAEAVSREGSRPRATMVLQDDPHGVMYFVASWLLDEAGASS
jgi:hypothetical protein